MTFYQHCDEVIEAARLLRHELIEDAPEGNTKADEAWVGQRYPEVCALARQTTEEEERRAIGPGTGGAL
ncbi:MAG: hypothetical protein AAGC81_02285 [Pseudomonadota bacterium]